MKDLSLLVWLSQLGLSVVMPPVLFILLAVWLHKSCSWGVWVIWVGVILGLCCAVTGLLSTLKALCRVSANKEDRSNGVSFNDHE